MALWPHLRPVHCLPRNAGRGATSLRIARQLRISGALSIVTFTARPAAQYGRGSTADEDLLTVYAEAFERDADPEDFSLTAMVAHERGHQLLARHPRLAKRVAGRISLASEEILASLLGAMVCVAEGDRGALVAKATVELLNHGETLEVATRRLQELWNLLETLL